MMDIQTINQMDSESATPEIACKVEEAKGLGPEIICCKVIYPGIDEYKCLFHNAYDELVRE
jgi:hypothetical protein